MPNRRRFLTAIGVVGSSVAVAGCSSSEPNPEPEQDQPEEEPEQDQPEEEPEQEANNYDEFNPEPMGLLEFAQKTAIETDRMYLSAHKPKKTREAYGAEVTTSDGEEHNANLFNYDGERFEIKDGGLVYTDNPVASYQIIYQDEISFTFRAGQLPQGNPRKKVVQNFKESGNTVEVSTDEYDIVHNGDYIAHVINDEIIATIGQSSVSKKKDIQIAKEFAENYDNGNPLPEKTTQLNQQLDGEDFLSIHKDENFDYIRGGRDYVQPKYAVTRGDMGEGVETAWVFDHSNVAEATAEEINEDGAGPRYNPPASQNSNVVILSGIEAGIKMYFYGRSHTLGFPDLYV